jgi:prepilin signal peptidase PulO-like enzyme (type II secretory pathway)
MIEFLFVLFCGLAFGSFVTLASYRLPLEQDIVVKPSRCPKCETPLTFKDLWPVFSWVMSKGKCRHCGAPISARYPLIEIATAAVILLVYSTYGLSPLGIVLALMGVTLMVMIAADIEHYIIPDQVHYALLPLGIAWHWLLGTPARDVVEGLVLGAFTGLALHYGYRWLRKKEGLGFGDVKFLAVAGLWLTLKPFIPFLFFSGILGIITALIWRCLKRGVLFPFGPALAISLFLCVAYPRFPELFWSLGGLIRY